MHKEEAKLIAELRRTLGDANVTTLHPDDLGNQDVDQATVLVVTMDAGNAAQATDMALAANLAVARNPQVKFVFGINGCIDDPREIDQIPAAVKSLRFLYATLSQAAFWRFTLENQALMLVGNGLGHREGTELHVPPILVKDPNK